MNASQELPTDPRSGKANKFQKKRPISLKLPPARPKSVYLPLRRAPVSKFGCMTPRSAAFRFDSGQLRFAMMRNLTVIVSYEIRTWSLATASDRQNVTLAGEGRYVCPIANRHRPPNGAKFKKQNWLHIPLIFLSRSREISIKLTKIKSLSTDFLSRSWHILIKLNNKN